MRQHSSFESKVLAAFVVALLVAAGLTAMTWKLANDATSAANWVAHTHEVLDGLARVRSDALQVELSTQNYRISGDPARIVERDAAIANREITLQAITQLTAENTRQQERLAQLRKVTAERLAISRQSEFLRRTQGMEAATAYVASAPLKETRARAYGLLDQMVEEERQLLKIRIDEQASSRKIMIYEGGLLVTLLLALLTATYVVIRRQLAQTQASQRALAESEQRLSITLDSIGDAVLATDTDGRITRMNPVAERLTGWTFAQALGRPVDEVFCIINEHTRKPAAVPVALVLATGAVHELANHTSLIARDGRECAIADSAAPIRDASGQVSGVVLVFRDETTAREAQRTVHEYNDMLERRVQDRTAQLHESEEHLRGLINNVPALIAFVDAGQRYVYVNQSYQKRFAAGRADLTGCTVREILGEERYALASPIIAKALQGQPQHYDWQPYPGVWQAIQYVPKQDAQGQMLGYYVLGTDITERKISEEKIQTLNTELAQHVKDLENASRALRTLSAGNRTMLRAANEQELVDSMCAAIVVAGGYHAASVWFCVQDEFSSLRPIAQSGHPGGMAALSLKKRSWANNEFGHGAIATAIRTGQPSVVHNIQTDPEYVHWLPYLPGYACGVAYPLRVDGSVIGGLAIYATETDAFGPEDVQRLHESADDLAFGIATLRARASQQITQAAMHRLTRYDVLTGLPNEVHFTESLGVAIDAGKTANQPFAVLQTNIERLSEINDALGFAHGDQVLREFADRLRAVAPESALIARLRGDEFAILLPNSDSPAAIALAQIVEQKLAQPFPVADIALDVSVRIGVVQFPAHGLTTHDLFRHMDIAVRQAKKKGVGHIIFDPTHIQDQSKRLGVASELRRAIENGDLMLYLQPKVEIATGRVCGAEGLVRWKHAERGLILPYEFIGLAEHTGLIKPLTEWVIDAGLCLNQAWQRQGCALPIALNLSARNLRDEDLLEKIRHMQTTQGVAHGLLELEITESMVMDDPEFAMRVLRNLHDDGIPLYIDDFGTGYSSLSYLQKLPVDYIKIDQSFVFSMSSSQDSAVIVRSTIDLAHDLGHKVVAEGVETQAHWDQLAAFGCDIAQGYFIAKPMPSEAFQDWLAQFRPPYIG